jgi:tRNA U34 5-carboxymethylaminomethyl modifying GTPase MnmE/TrmE
LGDTPCHGDVFHIQKQCESLANVLARVARGATSRRKVLDVKMDAAKANSCGNTLSAPLTLLAMQQHRARQ